MSGWLFIIFLLLLGGLISTLGDLLGSKIGKLHINESDSISTSFPSFKEQFNKAGGSLS